MKFLNEFHSNFLIVLYTFNPIPYFYIKLFSKLNRINRFSEC